MAKRVATGKTVKRVRWVTHETFPTKREALKAATALRRYGYRAKVVPFTERYKGDPTTYRFYRVTRSWNPVKKAVL